MNDEYKLLLKSKFEMRNDYLICFSFTYISCFNPPGGLRRMDRVLFDEHIVSDW